MNLCLERSKYQLMRRQFDKKDGEFWNLHTRFWQERLPSSGYRRAKETVPDIEVYPEIDMPKENYNYELWFPDVKE